ncbi:MAG: hypothetical protein HOK71_10125 [Planctomycetaceae bacterium]|jgi:hypothetical protein|nr:hypothetical protein [Planctomycetaceae bacterium]
MKKIAERLIELVDWPAERVITGSAKDVGQALRELLSAEDPDSAGTAYWKLENHVVAQGSVFQAAEAVTRVLVSAFANDRPEFVKIAILDLLYQILTGEPDTSEVELGNQELVQRCRLRAREGLWLFFRELEIPGDAAADVLNAITNDNDPLETISAG